MKLVVKRVLNVVFWVVIITAFVFTVYGMYEMNHGVRLPMYFGNGLATVDSGSMEPVIHVGSLITLKKQDSYNSGDIITYKNEDNILITHRVVKISNGIVTTKGDANKVSDPTFSEENIVGRVTHIIPGVGYIVHGLKSPVTLFVLILIVLYCICMDLLGYSKRGEEEILTVEREMSEQLLKEEVSRKKPKSSRKKKSSNSELVTKEK